MIYHIFKISRYDLTNFFRQYALCHMTYYIYDHNEYIKIPESQHIHVEIRDGTPYLQSICPQTGQIEGYIMLYTKEQIER